MGMNSSNACAMRCFQFSNFNFMLLKSLHL
jgi:hypothetical protein